MVPKEGNEEEQEEEERVKKEIEQEATTDQEEIAVESCRGNAIQFEFTARNSPEFNGKIERKFAIIFGRIRVNYNAAGLTKKLRNKLWGEACMTAIDVENLLVSSNHDDPSYREFYKKNLPQAEQL
jgi:hypothetical protein